MNSNVSVASSNLTSITEDRKKSIINGTNKKVCAYCFRRMELLFPLLFCPKIRGFV